ncbi:MAG: S-layer homology domain-containing protein, partial [Clostridia bacterium]|nr:S-layer homology domain-containing protein [Clostridia bacterium]
MKKTWKLTAMLCAALTAAFTAGAQSFEKQKSYNNEFCDVPESEWYASEVKNVYEFGLMNGNGDGSFRPGGNVTIAEAVTLASRCSAIYGGETIAASVDGEWYKPYFDNAVKNGLMEEDTFDNPERPAKRHEVALLFRKALPDSYFTEINDVERIIDVSENAPYEEDLLTLYRA